jgi:hypothetical protein
MGYMDAKTVIMESMVWAWTEMVSRSNGEDDETHWDLCSLVRTNKAMKAASVSLYDIDSGDQMGGAETIVAVNEWSRILIWIEWMDTNMEIWTEWMDMDTVMDRVNGEVLEYGLSRWTWTRMKSG